MVHFPRSFPSILVYSMSLFLISENYSYDPDCGFHKGQYDWFNAEQSVANVAFDYS